MKNRHSMIILVLLVCFLFAGCTQKDNENGKVDPVPTPEASSTADDDTKKDESKYSFDSKGIKISMDSPAKPILDALGEPFSVFESPSCAFQGIDRVYSYSGFELYTYTDENDESEAVFSVVFMDDSITTNEGIGLGDKLDKIVSQYGEEYEQKSEQYTYIDGNCKLSFLLENGEVASIEYSLVTE